MSSSSLKSTSAPPAPSSGGLVTSFVDSFRRKLDDDDIEKNVEHKDDSKLNKAISTRHLGLVAIGTGAGSGLLVNNGRALASQGPASLLIGYGAISTVLYCMIQSAGELGCIYNSMTGGFTAYPSMLVDEALGFACGWVYCFQWLIVLPIELLSAALTLKFWTPINPDCFVVIFYVVIVGIHLFGVRGYAEAEFCMNLVKSLAIIGFIILGIILAAGGAGNQGYVGAKNWHAPDGGAFAAGFKGVCGSLIFACFSYGGSEFVALTAAEQKNPRKSMPTASKFILYRIFIVYMLSMTLLCFLVPYKSPRLLGHNVKSSSEASPYVIALESFGVKVCPHIMNAVILVSVMSVGNSAMYSSPRLLLSLSEQGYAPSWFNYVDRQGRPIRCFVVTCVFGLLGFIGASKNAGVVFAWLAAIAGLSQVFIWMAICLSHIRFRAAMKAQGRSLGEVGYKAQTGVWGSWYSVIALFLVLMAQFWVALAPIGENGKLDANQFFQNYLAMPVWIVLYIFYKLWKRQWHLFIPASKIDLVSFRHIFDEQELQQEIEEEKEKARNSPWYVRFFNFWC